MKWTDWIISFLDQCKNEVIVEENPESIKLLLNSINVITTEVFKNLVSGSSIVLWAKTKLLKQKCASFDQELKSLIPKLKSCVHEFREGGPWIGVNNHNIKFRLVEIEIFLICDLDDLIIRHHLANDDNSRIEVELIQNYEEDAICDAENDISRTWTPWVRTNEIQCFQSMRWTHQ